MAVVSATIFADYITREAIDAVDLLGPEGVTGVVRRYILGILDPCGGVNDAMTLAVAHLRGGAICVLDAVLKSGHRSIRRLLFRSARRFLGVLVSRGLLAIVCGFVAGGSVCRAWDCVRAVGQAEV